MSKNLFSLLAVMAFAVSSVASAVTIDEETAKTLINNELQTEVTDMKKIAAELEGAAAGAVVQKLAEKRMGLS